MHPLVLICMMGLPRSGKSTKARELGEKLSAPVVNRDSIRTALHGQRFVAAAEDMVKAVAMIMVRHHFEYGYRVVIIDETNMKRSTRDFWSKGQWETSFLHINTSKEECIRRAKEFGDDEIQPIIEKMAAYAEPLEADEERYDAE